MGYCYPSTVPQQGGYTPKPKKLPKNPAASQLLTFLERQYRDMDSAEDELNTLQQDVDSLDPTDNDDVDDENDASQAVADVVNAVDELQSIYQANIKRLLEMKKVLSVQRNRIVLVNALLADLVECPACNHKFRNEG